jgi:hypothetical protein
MGAPAAFIVYEATPLRSLRADRRNCDRTVDQRMQFPQRIRRVRRNLAVIRLVWRSQNDRRGQV